MKKRISETPIVERRESTFELMEEMLKTYGISKHLFMKVAHFIKLQVDQKIIYTLKDQEQIAAEILIMASEGIKADTGAKNNALLADVSGCYCDCCMPSPDDPFDSNPICEKCNKIINVNNR